MWRTTRPRNLTYPSDVSLKVIADHARSLTFMIGDGILPSNLGRGYILRRVLRRAVRHGRLLGIDHEFLGGAVDVVVSMYGDHYPEIREKQDYIKKVIHMEESSFLKTLKSGCDMLDVEITKLQEAGKTELDGDVAFKLSDTFGFPKELTAEIMKKVLQKRWKYSVRWPGMPVTIRPDVLCCIMTAI